MTEPIRYIQGDITELALQGQFRAIAHGANCFHTMGAGVALAVANRFPEALRADMATDYGDPFKLGKASSAEVETYADAKDNRNFTVYNLYTQYHPGKGDEILKYASIRRAFRHVFHMDKYKRDIDSLPPLPNDTRPFAIPRIGCGLAGLEWDKVLEVIEPFLPPQTVVVDLYPSR